MATATTPQPYTADRPENSTTSVDANAGAAETRAHVEHAMRLSPRDPLLFRWHLFIGLADIYLGRAVHAQASLRKSVEINPNWGLSHFVLAGALALAGLLGEATEVCAIARQLAPNFTIAKYRAEAISDNPVYLTQRKLVDRGAVFGGGPRGLNPRRIYLSGYQTGDRPRPT
jgi:hypothetical protein